MRLTTVLIPLTAIMCGLAACDMVTPSESDDEWSLPNPHGGTVVPDTIWSTTWTAEGSPYVLRDTAVVPAGNTLIIDAGVTVVADSTYIFTPYEVRFRSHPTMIVNGSISGFGTASEPIWFQVAKGKEWSYFNVMINSGGSLSLNHASIEYFCITADTSSHLSLSGVAGRYIAVRASSASVAIQDSKIRRSGGIDNLPSLYLRNSSTQINRVTIDSCFIGFGVPQVIEVEGGVTEMEECRIVDNGYSDTFSASMISAHDRATLRMRDCVIARNRNMLNPSIFLIGNSDLEVINCTIAENSADNAFNPLFGILEAYTGSDVTFRNSIIHNNYGDLLPSQPPEGVTVKITYTAMDFDTLYPGEGNLLADPMFRDADAGDYSLLPGSPAIDAGDPSDADLDGSRADMGARF